jgi:hypothetical protein
MVSQEIGIHVCVWVSEFKLGAVCSKIWVLQQYFSPFLFFIQVDQNAIIIWPPAPMTGYMVFLSFLGEYQESTLKLI